MKNRVSMGLILLALGVTLFPLPGYSDPPSAQLPRLRGPIPTWWNGLDEWADIPKFPEPFRQSSLGSKKDKAPLMDLQNSTPLTLPLVRYSLQTQPVTREDFNLEIPAGTRWTRVAEGYGQSKSPAGRFLSIKYQLSPCPPGYPRNRGPIQLEPKGVPTALFFILSESDRSQCRIELQVYSAQIRDEGSRAVRDALIPIPRVPQTPTPSTAATSDRLEPRDTSSAPSPAVLTNPAGSTAPSSEGAQ